ncbi:MAG: HAMP domain-containing sensor histidine kinase, partial [Patescibacteria group bacterium]
NERMIALVNDMLAVARLESGTFEYRFVPVQFEKLIEETIAGFTPAVEAKDIRLEFVTQTKPLPKWNMDPEKMRNVLQNLLDNAIKYVRKGGTITVEAEIKNGALHIVVKDDGMGIPDDAQEKIFTRFFRAANAMAAETNGSGLGLFIARNIVLAHNGKIWFESVPGKGTAFHILLPERS